MAVKNYILRFGTDNPANKTGLSPTFIRFSASNGGATTAPSIFEFAVGAGLYIFSYEPTGFLAFVADGGTSLGPTERYIAGVLDINDRVSETGTSLIALSSFLGTTLSSIGSGVNSIGTRLGTTADSFGDSVTNPTTLFGYLKRIQELEEGNSQYVKATGAWAIYNRGGSVLLRTKSISETADAVNKT